MNKSQIDDLAKQLPTGYTYRIQKTANDLNLRIKEVKDEMSAKIWLKKLMFHTKVTWRSLRTYPNSGRRNIYKIDLKCQHAKTNKAKGLRYSKTFNCRAALQIIVRKFTESAVHKDPLDAEWPGVIIFKYEHNHLIESKESLKSRDLSSESKEKLMTLFRIGYEAAAALHYLRAEFQLEYGSSYFLIESDAYYIPNQSVAYKQLKKFHVEFGAVSDDQMLQNLFNKLDTYCQNTPGKAKFSRTSDDKHYFVTICTPIMMRAHATLSETAELMVIETLGGLIKQRHRLYFLSTPTPAGIIPIAAIIADCEKAYVLQEALTLLKSIFPGSAFYGQHQPQVIVIDKELRKVPLQEQFRKSQVLFCQFHFLKEVRSWLCREKNEINCDDRHEIYLLVKDVLYAIDEDTANEKHMVLMSSEITRKYKHFLAYYQSLWQDKHEWAMYTRHNALIGGKNRNIYVEFVFRTIKDCFLEKPMTFKLTQLVHFLLTVHETYLEKRLVDFCNNTYPKYLLDRMLQKQLSDEQLSFTLCDETTGLYCVLDIPKEEERFVEIANGTCTCSEGQIEKPCKHASIILLNLESEVHNAFQSATADFKQKILYVALGNTSDSHSEVFQECGNNSNISEFQDSTESTSSIPEFSSSPNPSCDLVQSIEEDQIAELNTLYVRILDGVKNNPKLFKPALERMLENANNYCSSEAGLLHAMNTFGLNNTNLSLMLGQKGECDISMVSDLL